MQLVDTDNSFSQLITLIRQGDQAAAEELVRRYEAELRIVARVRLSDPALRRFVDSMDVCQSIMANFFVRASAGQFDLETPEQLLKLLSSMVRNKVTDLARHAHRDCRDARRLGSTCADELPLSDAAQTPSQIVAHNELVAALRERMTGEEKQIAQQRSLGMNWSEIAAQTGSTAEAVRKRLKRAVVRAACDLGLDEVDDG